MPLRFFLSFAGAILRSKVRWHEEGERNTKYFYSLEKRHHDIKTVSKLKVGDNCYIEDQFEILEEKTSSMNRA